MARVLIVGDSTAVGVGVDHPAHSVAGLLSARYPTVSVENVARVGARWRAASQQIASSKGEFRLILIMLGANDILHVGAISSLQSDVAMALAMARRKARSVVLVGSPDIGRAPAMPGILRHVLTGRSWRLHELLARESRIQDAAYIDLLESSLARCHTDQLQSFYADDGLHPNERSHKFTLARIVETTPIDALLNFCEAPPGRPHPTKSSPS